MAKLLACIDTDPIVASSNNVAVPPKPKHICSLTDAEKRNFLASFDLVLSDCDGVIWDMENIIVGSGPAYNRLKQAKKQIVYITNNSVRPPENYLNQFKVAGIEVDLNDIIHPARSIVDYLKEIKFQGIIYCIATEIFKNVLRQAGYTVIDGPNKILEESYTDLARHVFCKEPVRAVVIDVDFNLSAPKLIRAQQYLNHPECILIAGATDVHLPIKKGVSILGPGSFPKILADATGKKPSVLGKPGWDLGQIIMRRYGIKDPSRVLVIGDMLEQDISFGRICGFQTVVVLTGGCSKEDLNKCLPYEQTPDYYADSVADFIHLFSD